MKIVTSKELVNYPAGSIFRTFRPAYKEKSDATEGLTICHLDEFGDFQVIVETTDFNDGSGPTISRDGDLFDIYPSENLQKGENYPITNHGSTSCCGCYGHEKKELFAVYSQEDIKKSLLCLINPKIEEKMDDQGWLRKKLVR